MSGVRVPPPLPTKSQKTSVILARFWFFACVSQLFSWHSFLSKALDAWRALCPKGADDLVFPNGIGNVQSHSNFYNRVFKPLMIECGIADEIGEPRFSPHLLRHAAASLFIEQGRAPKKIHALLGHSTIMMTFDVYGHLLNDPSKDVELMDKMEQDLLAALSD